MHDQVGRDEISSGEAESGQELWSCQATLAAGIRHGVCCEGLCLLSEGVAMLPEVFPASLDGDFEVGLGSGLLLGPALGLLIPRLVVEGPLDHGVDLLVDRTLVFDVLLPAHLGSVVLAAAGGAGRAICWAVDASVGSTLLFAVSLESAVVARASFGGRGSGCSWLWLALSPG